MTIPHRLPGLDVREHVFEVPVDYQQPKGETLRVFAREVVDPRRADERLPWMVFLQGGPGFGSPRPTEASGWVGRAVQTHRVLLLDQRGTGRSTPISVESVQRFDSPNTLAAYLAHFRADNIVRDCEFIRRKLIGDERWTLLGQSFGGFCSVRYLSASPQGLAAAIITGGLPSLTAHADDVYRHTYPRVLEQNRRYFARYPEDQARFRAVAEHLEANDVRLPEGGPLTRTKLQQLGLLLGFHDGHEQVHYLLEEAWTPGGDSLSYTFLRGFEHALPYDTNPLFTVLHEACYAQGGPTGWSAERIRAEFPQFDDPQHFLMTGEMIYPWMLEQWPRLRPLAEAAQLLADKEDWPQLYDAEVLARNEVPVVAAVYDDDMYVGREYSDETAKTIGNLRAWVTNEYPHSGLRARGDVVLGRLLDMLDGLV
ncbi:MAG: alpha/beta fold hydrolase [Myxococcota bacterium]